MAKNLVVTVTDDSTVLYQALGPQAETVMIDNTGSATITIGGKDVADGEGPQLAVSTAPLALTINEDTLYAITGSGTAVVQVAAWISGPNS